jgi:XTP/dITP diphosphohydrolase
LIELVIATNNRHKFEEIAALLSDLPVKLIPLSAYPDAPELKEEGRTYSENAISKARTVAGFTRKWALADDTGLEVTALNGAPGVYSARYAGEGVTFADNRRKLLKELTGIPWERRTARFRCVMALVEPSGKEMLTEGAVSGYITEEERGTGGFGYDAVFYRPDSGKTFAELSSEEKNRISHRARAAEKVKVYLRKQLDTIGV